MNNIIIETLESELMYNETVILKYKIEYPEMVFGIYEYGQHIFNLYNRRIAYNLELAEMLALLYCNKVLI